MVFSILTLFPDMFTGPFSFSIIKRAQAKNLIDIRIINIRDFALDAYKSVDGRPYGGGVGMILKVDILDRALQFAKNALPKAAAKTILLDPKGTTYTQAKARELAQVEHLIFICGHYEGIDARAGNLVDEQVSIGNYVLTGGELAAMVITDSIVRLIPGVLPKNSATITESFSENLLEEPQYTRPQVYKGMRVPQVLMSGHHQKIVDWGKKQQRRVKLMK